ncbi:glycerol-3-phosphate dehydrogenase [NAD(+)], cytoplasmic isoform X1 [Rhizophagus clarus]|uniref:Glycerol-3-phosphate dehydrogenase [NAD(+)] n=1 Tax=Rhizophagus clarus TaxID=94130 RepID=A0A8H3R1I1_9GLOM|nr:glycerol-3-phosphate dehydrogenase [NAD(+)], cytoplasmic isoform X1 [Rhizophagus clarus]
MIKEARIVDVEKVAVIGSGNWGTVIARMLGTNVVQQKGFDHEIKMWVFEEMIGERKLTDLINEKHENIKYLPGIRIPDNIIAVSDILEAAKDATILVIVIPHQFVRDVCDKLKGKIHPKAKAITLVKGFDTTETGIRPISHVIKEALKIPVCSLSGANLANEIAEEKFSETTIGYKNRQEGELFKRLFETKYFKVGIVDDVLGVELCGALKNVVAIAAGIIDGLKLGDNTKAAVIRIGLLEMKKYIKMFYKGIKDETFFESCGIADVITTCYGGRNRKAAEAFIITGKSFEQLEKELLNGQKLQGTLTAKEIYSVLNRKGLEKEFPLFTTVYRIVFEGLDPHNITFSISRKKLYTYTSNEETANETSDDIELKKKEELSDEEELNILNICVHTNKRTFWFENFKNCAALLSEMFYIFVIGGKVEYKYENMSGNKEFC